MQAHDFLYQLLLCHLQNNTSIQIDVGRLEREPLGRHYEHVAWFGRPVGKELHRDAFHVVMGWFNDNVNSRTELNGVTLEFDSGCYWIVYFKFS